MTKHICRLLYNESEANCWDQLGLMKHSFKKLFHILCEKGRLHDTIHVTIEEFLTMFLYVLAHNLKFRGIKRIYIRSTETINRRIL